MDSFTDILQTIKERKPRKQHEFQTFGLMLAEKLKDTKRISMYIKFAKELPRERLNQALRLALDAKERRGRLGDLFLWHLKELKKQQMRRVFIGLFPVDTKERNKLEGHFISPILRYVKSSPVVKVVPVEQLHLTMFFSEEFPADHIPQLQTIATQINKKYALPQEIVFNKPIPFRERMIVSLSKTQVVYRIFYTLKKEVPAQTGEGADFFKRPALFHLTLARIGQEGWLAQRQEDFEKKVFAVDELSVQCVLRVVESRLTKDGPRYKILP